MTSHTKERRFYSDKPYLKITWKVRARLYDFIAGFEFDYLDKYANTPAIKVIVKEEHFLSSKKYENRNGVYLGWNDYGVYGCHHYRSQGDGYYGRSFKVQMRDGSEVELKGPWWGGNSGLLNAFPEHNLLIDMHSKTLTDSSYCFGTLFRADRIAATIQKLNPEMTLFITGFGSGAYLVPGHGWQERPKGF